MSNLIYRATFLVTSKNLFKIYIGSTGNTLKEILRNHKKLFKIKIKYILLNQLSTTGIEKNSGLQFIIKRKYLVKNNLNLINVMIVNSAILKRQRQTCLKKTVILNKINERQNICVQQARSLAPCCKSTATYIFW